MNFRMPSLFVLVGLLFAAGPAFAIGTFGAKIGVGLTTSYDGLPDGVSDPEEPSTFIIGGAWKTDLGPIGLEVNALVWRNTVEGVSSTGEKEDQSTNYLALPALAKFDLSPIPTLKLSLGGGLEPRILVSADEDKDLETMVWYLPIALQGTLDLNVIAAGIELRYEHQLTAHSSNEFAEDVRAHQVVALASVFF